MIGKLATSLGILLALGTSSAAFAHDGSSSHGATVWYSSAPAYYGSHDARHIRYTHQPGYRGPTYSTRYGAIPPQHRSVIHGIVITSPLIRTYQDHDRSYHSNYNRGYDKRRDYKKHDKRRDHDRDRKRYDDRKRSW